MTRGCHYPSEETLCPFQFPPCVHLSISHLDFEISLCLCLLHKYSTSRPLIYTHSLSVAIISAPGRMDADIPLCPNLLSCPLFSVHFSSSALTFFLLLLASTVTSPQPHKLHSTSKFVPETITKICAEWTTCLQPTQEQC